MIFILYYIILYYTILYYTILYYIYTCPNSAHLSRWSLDKNIGGFPAMPVFEGPHGPRSLEQFGEFEPLNYPVPQNILGNNPSPILPCLRELDFPLI